MRKFIVILALALLRLSLVNAQVPKKTMVEHFTNTKCSICASRNPGLKANFDLHPDVLHISIHPSAPYSTCYLSQQNTVDNDARTNYYGVYGGTPRIVINGTVISNATNYADTSLFASYGGGMSTMRIDISQFAVGADSIQSRMVIKRVLAGPPMPSAVLFAGLVEDTVFGNGGNGELQHYNVLRRALFTSQGTAVNLPASVGDSLVMTKTEAYGLVWDQDRMATVAILQEASSKALIQCEMSSTFKNTVVTGMARALEDQVEIVIYPNPAHEFLNVKLEVATGAEASIEMLDLSGKLVASQHCGILGSGSHHLRIATQDLPAGMYMARVQVGKARCVRKVLIAD